MGAVTVNSLKPLAWTPFLSFLNSFNWPWSFVSIPRKTSRLRPLSCQMAASEGDTQIMTKLIDSHLHVWASPQEIRVKSAHALSFPDLLGLFCLYGLRGMVSYTLLIPIHLRDYTEYILLLLRLCREQLSISRGKYKAAERYPYFPGQEPSLPGHVDFLMECMEEAGVDGAFIVQPINHKFDHSYVTSALKKFPSKFVGCCLANPAKDGSGIKQLEDLVLKDGYRAVRFNPYLWPSGEKMTNEIGKTLFSKAGELGVPVGFMCMKGLLLHLQEIEKLCTEFPSTIVLLDHLAFCKPPKNDEERRGFSELLKLSRFPQIYVKFSALFRVSRNPYPYEDLSQVLAELVSSYGAHRVMWGSDFPFIVAECGYKESREAVSYLAKQGHLPSSAMEWIMGKTIMQLFDGKWSDIAN